jgi:hypothetical protein
MHSDLFDEGNHGQFEALDAPPHMARRKQKSPKLPATNIKDRLPDQIAARHPETRVQIATRDRSQ